MAAGETRGYICIQSNKMINVLSTEQYKQSHRNDNLSVRSHLGELSPTAWHMCLYIICSNFCRAGRWCQVKSITSRDSTTAYPTLLVEVYPSARQESFSDSAANSPQWAYINFFFATGHSQLLIKWRLHIVKYAELYLWREYIPFQCL